MMQEVAEFGAENGIGGSALKGIVRAWMSMFRSAQRLNLSPKAVFEDLMQAGACLAGGGVFVQLPYPSTVARGGGRCAALLVLTPAPARGITSCAPCRDREEKSTVCGQAVQGQPGGDVAVDCR